MSWLPALRNLAGKAGLGKPGDSEVDTNSLFPSPRCCFLSVLRLGPSGAAFTTDAPGCSHPAPGLQHAFGGGGKGGCWEQGRGCWEAGWVKSRGETQSLQGVGLREMTWEHGMSSDDRTKGVSTLPLAAPGSHQLPQWAHGPALSHHSVSALWRVPGPNLHLHSGECTSSPLEGTITSPYLSLPEDFRLPLLEPFLTMLK